MRRKTHKVNRRRHHNNRGDNNAGKIKHVSANRDKYMNMARDAMSSGDRVEAENYFQHADHYFRVLAVLQEEDARNRPERFDQQENDQQTQEQNTAPTKEESSSDDAPKKPRSPRAKTEKTDGKKAQKESEDAPSDGAVLAMAG